MLPGVISFNWVTGAGLAFGGGWIAGTWLNEHYLQGPIQDFLWTHFGNDSAPPVDTQFHNPYPMYLGGSYEQLLESLDDDLHDIYHSGLDLLLPRGARPAGKFKALTGAARQDICRDFKEYTKMFDQLYGTSLWDAALRERFPDPDP